MKDEPAFPEIGYDENGKMMNPHGGMTLRDYFAAKAMQGLMSCQHIENAPDNKSVAEWSYKVADEMLKARNP